MPAIKNAPNCKQRQLKPIKLSLWSTGVVLKSARATQDGFALDYENYVLTFDDFIVAYTLCAAAVLLDSFFLAAQ